MFTLKDCTSIYLNMSKIIPKISLFRMALAGILFACQHDPDVSGDNRHLTVAGLHTWFEA